MTSELSEDQALARLQGANVTASDLASLAQSPIVLKSRKLLFALVAHPRTPRHVSLPLLRRMFTFDLMQLAVTPTVATDIKRSAEGQILLRLESLSAGEKISLARRASGRVAAELLQDKDARVITAALDNTRLTEISVAAALANESAPQSLFEIASAHPKWSQRREVQIALLRSEKTPIEKAQELTRMFPDNVLSEIVPKERRSTLAGFSQNLRSDVGE